MIQHFNMVTRWYNRCIFNHPLLVIIGLMIIISFLGYKAKDFKIDASAETLLLENDKDLRYARELNSRYGVNDFLIIAYTPHDEDILSDRTLESIRSLRDELSDLADVTSVLTILDVPLLESPPVSFSEFSDNIPDLESPAVDRDLAKIELRESEFYRDLIVSQDMKTTSLIVNLKINEAYRDLLERRNAYLKKQADGELSQPEEIELDKIGQEIRQHLDLLNKTQHENILAIRTIMNKYRPQSELFLGGISMVQDDMISYIKTDLKMFGLGVFLLLVIMLGIIFKRIRWIVLPMLCCFLSVLSMIGILGMFGLEVTVISSNFVSLQLIITLAIVIHLIVRYCEFLAKNPEQDQRTLLQNTVRTKFIPCLYAALTTIAGFGSLLFCDIKPVIHFGWMMSAGILLSLLLTFVLFPAGSMLLKKQNPLPMPKEGRFSLTSFLARFTESNGTLILVLTGIFSVLSIMGISRLIVENSFIDYFKDTTEIYQGMKVIDQKLGGTTPLDVIVQFEASALMDSGEAEAENDEFFDPFDDMAEEDNGKYWFLDDRMEVVEKVHDYLEGLPETGKVLSLGTMLKIGRKLNKGKSLDSLDLAVLYTKLPDRFRGLILTPYVNIENNEARFSIRIKDSLKSLKRDAFLKQIKDDMVNKLNLEKDKVHLAGTMVLYNNMLQSLFSSQIKTLGFVALALMLMFLILFRSVKLALIALFPNLFAAGMVLGVMGWMNIPLDMMTITIAAISIGIAVDDTIHYIYRFREEIEKDSDYYKTLHRCHGSIGHAMYYTSISIIIGFSILVFSNFWPTIYFGLFAGLAMFIALIAALTLLPQLLVLFKPFGPDLTKV
ncbi:MAG: RND family transporter [Deltaproteobacteria bacterium]|nr:RND family transporter [Deltaproteobacteria bacterium]